MRRFRLSTLLPALVIAALPLGAQANHITITGGIEGLVAPFRFSLADCMDPTKELTFLWQIVISNFSLTPDYSIQIKATSATASTCSYGSSTTETCTELLGAQGWTRTEQVKQTYTIGRLFPEGCLGTGTRAVTLFVKDNNANTLGTVEEAQPGKLELKYDFDPPAPPTVAPFIDTGDSGLNVNWTGASADAGATTTYRVYWSANPALLTGYPTCTGDYRSSCRASGTLTSTQTRIEGLTNGEQVYVAYAIIDDYGNEGPVSPLGVGVPEKIYDFYEYYAAQGGQESGGFCFLATAAYGSYWHPMVGSLRRFRDGVLLQTELGRDLVSFYYSWSPAMAEVIEDTPWLRFFFKVTLAPLAASAWFLMDTSWWEKLLLLAALWLALRFLRRAWRRHRSLLLATLALGLLAAAPAAFADSPRNFYFELKAGALAPDMDRRPGGVGLAQPYTKLFGDASRTTAGFEFEWQILKDVGSFGISGAMLFFQSVGRGLLAATGDGSRETTVLNVLPLQVNAVYRWDIPMRKYGVPFVPYAKAGFDYYVWWVLNGAGDISSFTDGAGTRRRGVGGTFGIHATLGVQFQLDIIDRRMQKSFDEEVGINHSYLFAEVVFSRVDDFTSSSFNFSSTYFLAGLALEF